MAILYVVVGSLISHLILALVRSWNAVRFERCFREEMKEIFEQANAHASSCGRELKNLFENELH